MPAKKLVRRRRGVGTSAVTSKQLGLLDARQRRRFAALNKRLDETDAILTNIAEALALVFTALQAQLGEQGGSSDDAITNVWPAEGGEA